MVGESLGFKTYGVHGRCDNGYGMWGSSKSALVIGYEKCVITDAIKYVQNQWTI
jgi:hypothetical protein